MPKGDVETYHEGGAWHNRIEGTDQVLSSHRTKEEAQAAGRRTAMDRKVEHIIRNLNGQIAQRNTYGHDPRSIPG
jgi:hypothetical protein